MYISSNGEKYYKVALHLHTTLSDGQHTPQEVATEYKSRGYDAIALTDHWFYGAEREISGLPIISGVEYNVGEGDTSVGEMHILGIGMKSLPQLDRRTAKRNDVVREIESAGGIAVLAHPAWSLNTIADLEALPTIAFTEIYNAVSEAHESMRAYSDYFVDAAANRGRILGILATDDAHYYDGTDNCRGWVYIKASGPNSDALLAALRSGDFYASQGPQLEVKRVGNKLVINTSPVSLIAALSNRAWTSERTLRGENLTHFEYEFRETEKWVRFEIRDAQGRRAYSQIFVK